MTNMMRGSLVGLAATLLLSTGLATAGEVTDQRLLNPEPGNWLTWGRTYNSNRYSPLDEINKDTVKGLKLAFAVPLMPPTAGAGAFMSSLQGTPLVDDGIMYTTDGWGRVYRIDMTSGTQGLINWIMDPKTDPEIATGILNNRGVALYGNDVYSLSPDGGLIATDAASGQVKWRVETQQNPAEYFTVAPLVADGKIIMGPAGGDGPMRGRLEARSPKDGSLIWTFNTIPGPEEANFGTWDGDTWKVGGAAIWVTGAYDPDSKSVIWGIGNPQPDFSPSKRGGDNLYSDSTVSLDVGTGKLNWFYQYTPNDGWDFDAVGTQQLVDIKINGEDRKIISHTARNGFEYILDRTNGSFISGSQYAKNVNWTKGIDPKTGKPLEYDPSLRYQTYLPEGRVSASPFEQSDGTPIKFCPYLEGGVNQFPTSYSEKTHYIYALQIEGCAFRPSERPDDQRLAGAMLQIDPTSGTVVKRVDLTSVGRGGALSTAGGIVFGESANGDFFAVDDTSMDRLWNINLGTELDAPPITFAINGKQYVAVMVGPSGASLDFEKYSALAADKDAASFANFQHASMLYVFAL